MVCWRKLMSFLCFVMLKLLLSSSLAVASSMSLVVLGIYILHISINLISCWLLLWYLFVYFILLAKLSSLFVYTTYMIYLEFLQRRARARCFIQFMIYSHDRSTRFIVFCKSPFFLSLSLVSSLSSEFLASLR